MVNMTQEEFVKEHQGNDFPSEYGRWIRKDSFDPPFLWRELEVMAKDGLVQLDKKNKRYRLTMAASRLADAIELAHS